MFLQGLVFVLLKSSQEMRSPHPAEGMYGSLRHLVKPILEKISVATRTWTASLKPTNSSLVPTSLKTWYPRSLLLTVVSLARSGVAAQTGQRDIDPARVAESCSQRRHRGRCADAPSWCMIGRPVLAVTRELNAGVWGPGVWGQTEFQVNLKLGLTPRRTHGSATIAARTGLASMYLRTTSRWSPSWMTGDRKRPCQTWPLVPCLRWCRQV